jgi:hypothetical protein
MKPKPVVRRCSGITRSGKPCQAAPVGATGRCLMHTQGMASMLGTRGGHRRAVFRPDGLVQFTPPRTPDELLLLIAATIVEVREARMDTKVANAIAC